MPQYNTDLICLCCCIVSAICNTFRPDLSTGIEEEDVAMAAKMRFLANGVNELKDYVETSGEHHLES